MNAHVQKELALSPAQIKEIDDLWDQIAGALNPTWVEDLTNEEREKREDELRIERKKAHMKAEASLFKILTPDQFKRLHQVSRRMQGALAITRADIVEELGVTTDQLKQFDKVIRAVNRGPGWKNMDSQQRKAAMRERDKAMQTAFLNVLTDQQRAKWAEMIGEEFEVADPEPTEDSRPRPRKTPRITMPFLPPR